MVDFDRSNNTGTNPPPVALHSLWRRANTELRPFAGPPMVELVRMGIFGMASEYKATGGCEWVQSADTPYELDSYCTRYEPTSSSTGVAQLSQLCIGTAHYPYRNPKPLIDWLVAVTPAEAVAPVGTVPSIDANASDLVLDAAVTPTLRSMMQLEPTTLVRLLHLTPQSANIQLLFQTIEKSQKSGDQRIAAYGLELTHLHLTRDIRQSTVSFLFRPSKGITCLSSSYLASFTHVALQSTC